MSSRLRPLFHYLSFFQEEYKNKLLTKFQANFEIDWWGASSCDRHCPKIIVSVNITVNTFGHCPLREWRRASRESFVAAIVQGSRNYAKRNEMGADAENSSGRTQTNYIWFCHRNGSYSVSQATTREKSSKRVFVSTFKFCEWSVWSLWWIAIAMSCEITRVYLFRCVEGISYRFDMRTNLNSRVYLSFCVFNNWVKNKFSILRKF